MFRRRLVQFSQPSGLGQRVCRVFRQSGPEGHAQIGLNYHAGRVSSRRPPGNRPPVIGPSGTNLRAGARCQGRGANRCSINILGALITATISEQPVERRAARIVRPHPYSALVKLTLILTWKSAMTLKISFRVTCST